MRPVATTGRLPVRRRLVMIPRGERGQSTVEFALLLPMVVLVLLAIVQVALVAREQVALTQAARETARQSAVDPDVGRAQAAGHNVSPLAQLQVDRPAKVGESLTVHASQHMMTNVPVVGRLFPDVDLSARAVMRVEK